MKKILLFLVFNCLIINLLLSQDGNGIITGIVKDLKTGLPIKDVTVRISQNKQVTYTNSKGEFKFENLPPGPYTIKFVHKNYSSVKVPHQEVFANTSVFLPVNLFSGSGEGEGTDEAFFIGGIEVVAKKSVLPEKVATSTEINSGEIEHLQASSLGDVMQMLPGVGQMNPGLGKQNQLALRGISSLGLGDQTSQSSMFGTKIMIDGSTISNNANMNLSALGGHVSTNAASGIDLRGIPADNVESVEVLRGVASAKYGDFTEGVVLVKTKGGSQPQRFKVKTNPDTKELNYNGGFDISDYTNINYNFNLGTSDRDIRREGDDYQRVAGQIKITNNFFDDKSLILTNGLYYTRLFDDYKDVKNPTNGTQYYNHSYSLLFNNDLNYKLDNFSKIEFHASINYTNQDKFKQDIPRGTETDSRYITGFINPGTYQVIYNVGTYIYQTTEKGNIWNITANGEWSRRGMKALSLIHNIATGFNYQYDNNTGEGYQFDPQKPPFKDTRPFSYDATPANSNLSLYFEDEIHGSLWKPFTLNLGFRYEAFSPTGIDFKGLLLKSDFIKSRSGSFFQPRLAFRYFLFQDTRIRLAYGKSAKSPSISYLYPQPQYLDVRDYYGDYRDTASGYPRLFTTYAFNRTNLNLKGYDETKYEVSLDQRFFDDYGLTLRGYYSNRGNEITSIDKYFLVPILTHPNFPLSGNEKVLNYVASYFNDYRNKRYANFYGLDLIITTKRIEDINSSFYIAGTFGYSEGGSKGGDQTYGSPYMRSTMDTIMKKYHLGNIIIPIYALPDQSGGWNQKLMMTYKWDFTVRKLGLWFTLWAQQIISVRTKSILSQNKIAVGYLSDINGGTTYMYDNSIPDAAKPRSVYSDEIRHVIVDTWTFNINISKSLYRGAEVSFFVNNFLSRTNDIFYGLEFSMDINRIFE